MIDAEPWADAVHTHLKRLHAVAPPRADLDTLVGVVSRGALEQALAADVAPRAAVPPATATHHNERD